MVVVGDHAGELDFVAYVGEEWSQVVSLTNADGTPWNWTGKTARLVIAPRMGATALRSLVSPTDLVLASGQITLNVDLDGAPAKLERYTLWQIVTATSVETPILRGYFTIRPTP